ncbi:hypothetical protein H4R18_002800 [Coemansia javaensis]|uniref:Uncharacterized protein n=1 Tax=Coemansia javaensis TaxID=2761396 RepID=A0A9W8HB22_9FUNG|nr:hypothetical protein H4R18_002800 [Coemansia javaensis]
MLVNEMYCTVKPPRPAPPSIEEKLYEDGCSRLEYLRAAYRRMRLLRKQREHFRQELDAKMHQQTLLVQRIQSELGETIDGYDLVCARASGAPPPPSAADDWHEVMEMSQMSVDELRYRMRRTKNGLYSEGGSGASSTSTSSATLPAAAPPHAQQHQQPKTEATQSMSYPWSLTPPAEEIIGMRRRLREMEKSPLFTAHPMNHQKPRPGPAAHAVAAAAAAAANAAGNPHSLP